MIDDPAFKKEILQPAGRSSRKQALTFWCRRVRCQRDGCRTSDEEGRHIWGKCNTDASDDDDCKDCPDPQGYSGDASGCDSCDAMPRYNVHLSMVSLHIKDTPVFYKPSLGPAINFTVSYHQRDPNPDTNFSYSNFGQKRTLDRLSFIMDDPTTPGANVSLYCRGGGIETYSERTIRQGNISILRNFTHRPR